MTVSERTCLSMKRFVLNGKFFRNRSLLGRHLILERIFQIIQLLEEDFRRLFFPLGLLKTPELQGEVCDTSDEHQDRDDQKVFHGLGMFEIVLKNHLLHPHHIALEIFEFFSDSVVAGDDNANASLIKIFKIF